MQSCSRLSKLWNLKLECALLCPIRRIGLECRFHMIKKANTSWRSVSVTGHACITGVEPEHTVDKAKPQNPPGCDLLRLLNAIEELLFVTIHSGDGKTQDSARGRIARTSCSPDSKGTRRGWPSTLDPKLTKRNYQHKTYKNLNYFSAKSTLSNNEDDDQRH